MDAANRKAPERGGGGASMNDLKKLYGQPKDTRSARRPEGIDGLLSRLDKVRQTGLGRWIARCPAHDDNRPSLHVTLKDDGAILIHCFSQQCGAADIMSAVGLPLADLFPDRGEHHRPAAKHRIPAGDILALLVHEVAIVAIAAEALADGLDLSIPDLARVHIAVQRIQGAWRLAYAH